MAGEEILIAVIFLLIFVALSGNNKRYCPYCGYHVHNSDKRCPKCGKRL